MSRISLVLVLSMATACTGNQDASVELHQFADCDELHSYMEYMADKEVRDSWRRGWAWGGVALMGGVDEAMSDTSAAPPAHSETNLQEAGVDEADLVKTDGTFLYVVAGGQLVISRAWPIEEAEQVSRLDVDGYPAGLYLLEEEGLAVVVANLWWDSPHPESGAAVGWSNRATTVVSVIDVSDPTSPELLREVYTTGELRQSRRVGDKLYLVTYEDIAVAWNAGTRREALRTVRNADIGAFQPLRLDTRLVDDEWVVESGPGCGCDQTWGSPRRGGTYLTHVSVLDLSDPAARVEGTAVVGQAHTVYAIPEALYVGYSEWRSGPWGIDGDLDTVLHRFDLTGDVPTYDATAEVEGVLTDQFALSERDGVLRIATTDMDRLESAMTTLRVEPSGFTQLDRLDGLAPGESITAARFFDDKAYVSTAVFVQDPLFTFDLADPEHIVLGGALEISGVSDYLHPLDEDHLIAVGVDQTEEFWLELQVSLFDVSDLSNPTLTDREFLQAWSSEAQSDHHAFTYFAPTESLTMPSWADEDAAVLEVLHVDTEDVASVGRVRQPASMIDPDTRWCAGVRRSVVIGEQVWAVSSAGLTAADLSDPDTVINSVAFEGIDPCVDQYYGGWGWGWGWAE